MDVQDLAGWDEVLAIRLKLVLIKYSVELSRAAGT